MLNQIQRGNEHAQQLNSHLTVMRIRLTVPRFTARTGSKRDLFLSAHFDLAPCDKTEGSSENIAQWETSNPKMLTHASLAPHGTGVTCLFPGETSVFF